MQLSPLDEISRIQVRRGLPARMELRVGGSSKHDGLSFASLDPQIEELLQRLQAAGVPVNDI
jgi:hypothetical protein